MVLPLSGRQHGRQHSSSHRHVSFQQRYNPQIRYQCFQEQTPRGQNLNSYENCFNRNRKKFKQKSIELPFIGQTNLEQYFPKKPKSQQQQKTQNVPLNLQPIYRERKEKAQTNQRVCKNPFVQENISPKIFQIQGLQQNYPFQFISQNFQQQQNNFIQQKETSHEHEGRIHSRRVPQFNRKRNSMPNYNINPPPYSYQDDDLNDLININIQVPKGRRKRQGPLVKICISQGTSQKRKKHLQHLKDLLLQNKDNQEDKKYKKKRYTKTQQSINPKPLEEMFPSKNININNDQEDDSNTNSQLDFSFNQAYLQKMGKKKKKSINISINITPSDDDSEPNQQRNIKRYKKSRQTNQIRQKQQRIKQRDAS